MIYRNRHICFAIGLSAVFAVSSYCRAQYATVCDFPPRAEPTVDIELALKEPIALDFKDKPLSEVVEHINDLCRQKHPGFLLRLDENALSAWDIKPTTPITFQIKDISLRSAMRLMFRRLELCCVVRNDAIVITTAEEADKSKLDPAEVIRQALAKKVDWNFKDTPLSGVLEVLQKDVNIPIRLDLRALNDLGVTPETKVTFKLSGVSAKTALKHLLHELGLTIDWDNEVLSITSPDAAECHLTTVIYDVSDLPATRRANGKTVPDYDQLSDLFNRTIKPTTWDEVGGPGSIVPYDAGSVQALVISQTWEVHEEICDLLVGLRKLRQWPLSKEEIEKLPLDPVPEQTPQFATPPAQGAGHGGLGDRRWHGGAKPDAAPPAPATPATPATEVPGGTESGGSP